MNLEGNPDRSSAYVKDENGVLVRDVELVRERWVRCVVFCSLGTLIFGYGCTVHGGVDVGAGDIEVDVIYTSFIMSVQYIGYLLAFKYRVHMDTGQLDNRVKY